MNAELPFEAAQEAWQSAIEQLQMEMPKATFDTWLRDTRLLSYEDGFFTIGAHTVYACEWLDSRLSSTVTRLLMGIMNRSVEIKFVVTEPENETIELPEPEACEPAESQDSTPEEDSVPATEDELLVEAHYDLAYDEIVTPDHVTVVPGYFCRHLRLIGPDLGWLYLAFRQAAFNAGARRGSKRERFSGKTISALSGSAERTFWNRIGKAETWERLKGLVTTTAAGPEWDTHSATPRRLPRKYIVSMSLPLTAADARSLRTWLMAGQAGVGGAEASLAAAAETPLDELLPLGAQVLAGDSPESVISIVRSLFADRLPAERLETLSTRLHKHIMPDKDLLVVTHFFIENVLPYLGAGPGWTLTLLRDRCYVNRETGEVRTQVAVQGGYAEIADWLGLTGNRRARTVWDWLNEKNGPKHTEPGKYKYPVSRVYLRETTKGKAFDFSSSPRTFDVLLEEIPEEILAAALDKRVDQAPICVPAAEECDPGAVCSIAHADHDAICSIGMTQLADDHDAICSIAMTRFADDLDAICSNAMTRLADDHDATCRVFKSLNLLNQSLITKNSPTPPTENRAGEGRVGGGQAFWDFDFLMANNQVAAARQIKDRQKETGASLGALAAGFVAWLLYAYSPDGKRIDDPVALAVKRLRENGHAGAGGDFDLLANLRPFALKALFDRDLAGTLWQIEDSKTKEIYCVNYRELAAPRKHELYRRLFGAQSD